MFIVSLLLFSMFCLFSIFYIKKYFTPERLKNAEKIPRNVPLGAIFGAAAIAWCVPQSLAVFSSNSVMLFSIIAIVAYLIGCFFLDYLFARALAGFIILLSHYFMAQSFAVDIPMLWLFSVFVLVMGTSAIVIGGIPHYMRDFIRKICVSKSFKLSIMAVFGLYLLISLYAALIQFL
ncbi:MAG TPA: hypothetical protein DD381_03230 [Lentisphaeria bacterium]|nr:MAG: hypothetical protein A2X47_03020 [Lentisphaerae bacterium GWF2_38_69]HBM15345.1 hypothetical protein [Lentisphaeria bacterium]